MSSDMALRFSGLLKVMTQTPSVTLCSRLITDRAAFWCATPHRMVSETEELDRWSPQSHRPSLADQNLSYNSQPWGLALLTKASMFQPLLPFDCWATVLSGRPRDRLAGRLSPACPIAPDPD